MIKVNKIKKIRYHIPLMGRIIRQRDVLRDDLRNEKRNNLQIIVETENKVDCDKLCESDFNIFFSKK